MEKINKNTKEELRQLLNSVMVGEFQKTLIKAILHNAENKNLSRADLMCADDLIRRYKQ